MLLYSSRFYANAMLILTVFTVIAALASADPDTLPLDTTHNPENPEHYGKEVNLKAVPWSCPGLSWFQCMDGLFRCQCKDGNQPYFRIGCCYEFPSCDICKPNNHDCRRYDYCQECKSGISGDEYDDVCNSCIEGYELGSGNCKKDINECLSASTHNCDQNCRNTIGSYYCTCNDGYSLMTDRHSCLKCDVPDNCQEACLCCDETGLEPRPESICLQCESSQTSCGGDDNYANCKNPSSCLYSVNDAHCLKNGQCFERCSWLGHYCFPGTCNEEYLATSCECERGFTKQSKVDSVTKCEIDATIHRPKLEKCQLKATSEDGEDATASKDEYINFQPHKLFYEFSFKFNISVTESHAYIKDDIFGIIDANFELAHYTGSGNRTFLSNNTILNHAKCSQSNFTSSTPYPGIIKCSRSDPFTHNRTNIIDGEKICQTFKAIGGGRYELEDKFENKTRDIIYFDPVFETHEICWLTDLTYPEHCLVANPKNCQTDILEFGYRVRRDNVLVVTASDWEDQGGSNEVPPSGINDYELTVFGVQDAGEYIMVNRMDTVIGPNYSTNGRFEIILPYPKPPAAAMYALYIAARDSTQESPNAREGRRMVLLDNSTYINISVSDPLRAVSASPNSNYTWQVHLGLFELKWTNHFYNIFHITTNLLRQMKKDSHITNVYDQTKGEIPISGTPNVHGIVKFKYKYRHADFESTEFEDVPNFLDQSLFLNMDLQDGQVVVVEIKAIDIMNNTNNDSITIHIDSSPPVIENMGLFKDGYKFLAVHNSKDLSTMTMQFEGFDPHSGLQEVRWWLGTTGKASDIGKGYLETRVVNNRDECEDLHTCSCPDIGDCQHFNYTIDLNHIIDTGKHNGQHHREYHFWIRITNSAFLITEDEFVVLADDSPPEVGVVLDGPRGSKDRDYQSTPHLSWNWHGFVDHESGINKYHFAVGLECYTAQDLKTLENVPGPYHKGETTFTFTVFEAKIAGFYRTSVIAFNNAMDISRVACSSGILLDITPPRLLEVDLIGVRRQEGIACDDLGQKYYVSPTRRLREMSTVAQSCERFHCSNVHSVHLMLPELLKNGTVKPPIVNATSVTLCETLKSIDIYPNMFMSSDNLWLTWKFEEPESQMLNFYVGVSRTNINIEEPDILGYQSTHNHTFYKCVHCGIGEGDVFFIQLKASNKAGLISVETFGPIVVDLTAPEFQGEINVSKRGQTYTVRWDSTAFYDSEDDSIITEYHWALGVLGDIVSVETWTSIMVKQDDIDKNYVFSVEYPAHKLQEYDQDRGLDYIFSVQAVNRAGLRHVETSEPFTVHSKVLPSSGIVRHVDVNGNVIGQQENTSTVCFSLQGFGHDTEDFTLNVDLRTRLNATYDKLLYAWTETDYRLLNHCKTNLDLETLHMYYISIEACNTMGCSDMAHSKGLFVASTVDIKERGTITDGLGCPEFFQYNIAKHVYIGNNGTLKHEYTFKRPNKVQSLYTLRLQTDNLNYDILESVTVKVNNVEYSSESWEFATKVLDIFYQVPLIDVFTNISIEANGPLFFSTIDLDACHVSIGAQFSKTNLVSKWDFDLCISPFITEYLVYVFEQECVTEVCSNDTAIKHVTVSGLNHIVVSDIELTPGHKYITSVSPCFANTCTSPIRSSGVLFDPQQPIIGYVTATLDQIESLVDSNHTSKGTLIATWQSSKSAVSTQLGYAVYIYDWAVALTPTGGSLVTGWSRIQQDRELGIVHINTSIEMPVFRRRTLYLAIRFVHTNGLPQFYSKPIELIDLKSSRRLEVFDLKSDFDLNNIKDMIHSSNIGALARNLHDNDVDFSDDLESINGAVLGTTCSVSLWTIQSDPYTDCMKVPNYMSCIARKEEENTVRFRRQEFEHGNRYYICMYIDGTFSSHCPFIKACSNGFLIDIRPPLAGVVHAGRDGVQADTSSMTVHWDGFVDIEEDVYIPYTYGIKEYYVAIGTSIVGDEVLSYVPLGTADHTILTGLNLSSGVMYYALVKACDYVGLCVTKSSPGVMVDNTPPKGGHIQIHSMHYMTKNSSDDMAVHYGGFNDPESGISHYEVAVGTSQLSENVIAFRRVDGGITTFDGMLLLRDGHTYFAQVKTTNRVGLYSIVPSHIFLYDSTPPIAGFVRWGHRENHENTKFTTELSHLCVHWGGFTDPHTGIAFYRLAIGTGPQKTDVRAWQDVGVHKETCDVIQLIPGKSYYATVEACNGVFLCTKASSTGPLIPDVTPPLRGIVIVGHTEEHQAYQTNRNSIAVRWVNFYDPESGIKQYKWCVGTNGHDTCDIVKLQNGHTSHIAFKTDIDMPAKTLMYVKVIAINNAGLQAFTKSKTFTIVTEAPRVKKAPYFNDNAELRSNTRFERSSISVSWSYEDETPIVTHSVSLVTHEDGINPLANTVIGNVDTFTYAFDAQHQMKDGFEYVFNVVACNAAGICTKEASNQFLVDSSPPHIGGFVEPMSWEIHGGHTLLNLSWTGFADPHSDILKYHITIGREYSSSDLSNGVLTIPHKPSILIQTLTAEIEEQITNDEKLYLTLWAENGAGLISEIGKTSILVKKAKKDGTYGRLDVEKHSCDIHYCTQDCTCAVLNMPCVDVDTEQKIVEKCKIVSGSILTVRDGPPGKMAKLTTSKSCLSGHWELNNASDISQVQRFEWSVGIKGLDPGVGIFEVINHKFWFDVELTTNALYCLPGERSLTHNETYVYYVRAWLGAQKFQQYSSEGISIDTTPPRTQLSRAVKDMDETFRSVIKFTTQANSMYCEWENVFSDAENGIARYEVYFGSSKGGNEVFGPDDVGLETNLTRTNLNLIPGIHYYTTVNAYNQVGMVTSMSSKGFVVDTEPPVAGIVHTSRDYSDQTYYSETLVISFQGFYDLHSYIDEYMYAISQRTDPEGLEFVPIGIQNIVEIPIAELNDGVENFVHVKVKDAAGWESIATSAPMIVDRTPPIGHTCSSFYEIQSGLASCSHCNLPVIAPLNGTCVCELGKIASQSGEAFNIELNIIENPGMLMSRLEIGDLWYWVNFARINEETHQQSNMFMLDTDEEVPLRLHILRGGLDNIVWNLRHCTNQTDDVVGESALTVKQVGLMELSLHWLVDDLTSSVEHFEVGIGTTPYGYQLIPLTDVGRINSLTVAVHLQHAMTVYTRLLAYNRAGLRRIFNAKPLLIDWTPPVITNISLSIAKSDDETFTVSSYWNVHDEESEVLDCLWALGNTHGSDSIIAQTYTDTRQSSKTQLYIDVGTYVYVTITCSNSLGQSESKVSGPAQARFGRPGSDNAYVKFIPSANTVYLPRGIYQSSLLKHLHFEVHGFDDIGGIVGYSYMLEARSGSTGWIDTGLTDALLIENDDLKDETLYTMSVRAVNSIGEKSAIKTGVAYLSKMKPRLSGRALQITKTEQVLRVNWRDLFAWDSTRGDLLYEVQIGPVEGSAVCVNMMTFNTSIDLFCKTLELTGFANIVIIAIPSSGEYITYSAKVKV